MSDKWSGAERFGLGMSLSGWFAEREVEHHGGGEGAHTELGAAGGPVTRGPDINHQN